MTAEQDDMRESVARLANEMYAESATTSSSPATSTPTTSPPVTLSDAQGAAPPVETPWKGKYPNPWVDDFSTHPIAMAINGVANERGPASEMKLGDSWAATVDYYMHTTGEVHPALMAFGTSVCFATVVMKTGGKTKEKTVKDPTKATTDSYGGVPDVPDYP